MLSVGSLWFKTPVLLFVLVSSASVGFAEGSAIKNGVSDAGKFTVQVASQKRFDGKWWTTAGSEEQEGFVVGFIDCYSDTAKRKIRATANFVEFREALSRFYVAHPDQDSATVPALMVRLMQTLKTKAHYLPGGEVWTEPHGFLDGAYWNQSTDKERIGFLEGYIQCYEKYMRRPDVKFSRTVEEYSELLSRYFESTSVDREDEKIAYVLHRLAARPNRSAS